MERSDRVWWSVAAVTAVGAAVLLVAGLLPTDPGMTAGLPAVIATTAGLELALTFEPEVLSDSTAYRAPRRPVALASWTLAILVPLVGAVLLVGPRGERLVRPLHRIPGVALPVGLAVATAVTVTALVRFPLRLWAGLLHDGTWGFRTRSGAGWLLDQLLVVTGRAALAALLAVGVVVVVRRWPGSWPARMTVLVAVAGPFALLLHPLVVHPLLLPTGPLPDGPHREAVVAVVARSSSPDVPVLLGAASLRTTRRNAVVTGLGPTQRIVLHDTLLDLEPRAVAAITAHELAHVERRDPLRGVLALAPVVLLAGLALRPRIAARTALPTSTRTDRIRTFAAAAVLVLALEAAAAPLVAAFSRTVEHRTDVRAVALSGDSEAYVTMLRSFVIDGLAEPEPPRWSVLLWATHPTPAARIAAVLEADARLNGTAVLARH